MKGILLLLSALFISSTTYANQVCEPNITKPKSAELFNFVHDIKKLYTNLHSCRQLHINTVNICDGTDYQYTDLTFRLDGHQRDYNYLRISKSGYLSAKQTRRTASIINFSINNYIASYTYHHKISLRKDAYTDVIITRDGMGKFLSFTAQSYTVKKGRKVYGTKHECSSIERIND